MKKKLIIMILIFIQISMMFISTVQADDDYYYIINYFAPDRKDEPIKIKKTLVSKSNKDKTKIYELREQIYNIEIEALSVSGLKTLDDLLGDFYNGAYQNLNEDFNTTYNKLYRQTNSNSVAARMIEAAKNPVLSTGSGYAGNTAKETLNGIIERRQAGMNPDKSYIQPPSSSAAGQSGQVAGSKTEEQKEQEEKEKTTIYQLPKKASTDSSSESLDDLISDADSFVTKGSIQYEDAKLQSFSTILYNILISVGVAIALIVGIIIGIKYMMASVEEKANYKQMLVPYVVGCVVVFGAFGIWKLVVTILENV